MSTKEQEKRPLTPAERRRREENRKKRMKMKRRKKMIRLAVLIGIFLLALAVVIGIVYGVVRLVKGAGGNAKIGAKGDTFVIALDAGHGGEDVGLTNDSLKEKEVTLVIVSKLQKMLENYGYQVVMIREDDTRISKEDRAQAVNDSGADLVVSVHLNYSENASMSGVQTSYKKDSKEGELLAEKVLDAVVEETGAAKGGFQEGSYTILEDTLIPSVMVEVGYASNAQEAAQLAEDAYCNQAAKGIAKGVIRCLDTDKE